MVDLDSLSDWDGEDEVTAALDGDDATTAVPASVWGGGDEVTATTLVVVPTRKRTLMAAARAGDTDDGATATGQSGDAVGALIDAHGSATKKRKYSPAHAARRQRRRDDRRGLRVVDRAPGGAGAQMGGSGGSRV